MAPRHEFYCYDYVEDVYYNCVGNGTFQYVCWDGGEWEWANYNENDLTPDNSVLTSIATDGILLTSPSADPNPGAMIPMLMATAGDDMLTEYGQDEEEEIASGYEIELVSVNSDLNIKELSMKN